MHYNNEDLFNILEIYKNLNFDVNKLMDITVCEVFTKHYESKGLVRKNETQKIGNTMFYSSEFFSPIDVITSKKKITNSTYSIHWFNASWYTPKQKFKNKLKKIINKCTFGLAGKIYQKIRKKG